MAPKILFVLTSHNKLGNLDKPTGWYLPGESYSIHSRVPF
jgi:hypothetical protein